jgi:hypothetical protein
MGLRYEELQGMVVPLISIDEFEPKTGTTEEVIVVAFFCKDEVPAYDLDDFIDKGIIEFLDSEVSPNPNEDNFYLVFVEFKRQPNFWLKLFDLVKDIENVTTKMDWQVQPYLSEQLYPLHDPALQQYVITDPDNYVPRTEIEGSVEDYLSDTNLLSLEMEEGRIAFGSSAGRLVFEYVGFDHTNRLIETYKLSEAAMDLGTNASVTALRGMLGKEWDISQIGEYLLINKMGDLRSIAVRRK